MGGLGSTVARALDADKMSRLGIRNAMRLAEACNGLRNQRRQRMRAAEYRRLARLEGGELLVARAAVSTMPRGTVLFIDTSRCFHYGARRRGAALPAHARAELVCRSDFSESCMDLDRPPLEADGTGLRRLVLDRETAA